MWLGPLAAYAGDPSAAPAGRCLSMTYFLNYPSSVGRIHITSGDDVSAAPDFDPKYLSRPEDMAQLKWGYKHSRELARRMSCYRGEHVAGHPLFSPGSEATCQARERPAEISAPDIIYTREDDEAIDTYLRKVTATAWHSFGTCAMTGREKGGVVDTHLNVYGVQRLKVADMSIAPANVSANTYSTALVIGEKAAAIIIEELGIERRI